MDVRTAFFALLVAVLGVIGFLLVDPFLQYVLAAGLIAFVLFPLHERLADRIGQRLSAGFLTAVTFVVAIVPLLILSLIIIDTTISFLTELQGSQLSAFIDSIRRFLLEDLGAQPEQVAEFESAVLAEFEGLLDASTDILLTQTLGLLDTTVEVGTGVLILAFLLYYFLVDGTELLDWTRQVTPLSGDVQDELYEEMSRVIWAVVGSHLLVAIAEGILGGLGLWVLGISNAAFWAVVMVILSVLPLIGIWLVWGPMVGYLIVVGDPVGAVILLVYGLSVLAVVDEYLRAILVDVGSGIHPAIVLIGVLGGIYLLGVMGLFLGPVLLALFKAAVTVFDRTHGIPSAG
ncbi:AI-2E family transporter [Natronoarchaeum sp. GCM10025321]|uniref:AI-2E family transporter n=1 Tax=Natronoarchaeum sp. GCM10025321 TaxID=3252684 RepID=UPI00360E70DA